MGSEPRTSDATGPGSRQMWRPLPRVASVAESWYHPGRLAATSKRFGSRVGLSQVARWRLELASVERTDDWSVRPPANSQHWRRQHDPSVDAVSADRPVAAGFGHQRTPEVVPQVRRGLPRMMVARGAAVPGSIAASLRPVTIDPALIDRTRRTPAVATAAASSQAQEPPRPSRREAKRSMEAFRRMLVGAGKLPPREGDAGSATSTPAQPAAGLLPPIAAPAGRTGDDVERDDPWADEPRAEDPWADDPLHGDGLPDGSWPASAGPSSAGPNDTRPSNAGPSNPRPGGQRAVPMPAGRGRGGPDARPGRDSRPGPDLRRSPEVAPTNSRPAPHLLDPGSAGAAERAAVRPSSPESARAPLPGADGRSAGPRTEQSAMRSRALSAVGLLDSTSTIGGSPPTPASAIADRDESVARGRAQQWPADASTQEVAPAMRTVDPWGGGETTDTVRDPAVRPPVALTDDAARLAAPRELSDTDPSMQAPSLRAPSQPAPTTQAPAPAAPAQLVQTAARRTMLAMLAAHERPDVLEPGRVPHEPHSPGGTGTNTDLRVQRMPIAPPALQTVVAPLAGEQAARTARQHDDVALVGDVAPVGDVAERGEVASRRLADRRALATAAPLQTTQGPVPARDDARPSEPAATTATHPAAPGGGGAAEAFAAVMRTEPTVAPRPLPASLRPLAAAIVGHTAVEMRTDHVARRALAAAGKRAATVGNVIHLQRSPHHVADRALIAHELTHVAHLSAEPRFFDDDRPSVEEARAEGIARLVQRSPVLAAPPAPSTARVQRASLPEAAPASPARLREPIAPAEARTSTIDQTLDAAELAARLTGAQPVAPAAARPAPAGGVGTRSEVADTRQAMRSVAPAAVVRRSPAPGAPPESAAGRSTSIAGSRAESTVAITRAAVTASVAERAHAEATHAAPVRRALTEAPSDGGLGSDGGNGTQPVSGNDPFTAQLADLRTASGTVDFVDWLMNQIEDRLLAELQRRGGRFRGEF